MLATTCRAALCACALLAAPAFADDLRPTRTVTVTGVGQVAAKPDMAIVTIGVVARAATAAEALRDNSAQMNRLLSVLDAMNVAARDRQTAGLQITPEYRYEGRDGRPAPDGYTVRNTLTLRIRNLATTGDVLDALVEAGANQLDGIVFDIEDKATLLDEARRQAVADARHTAELLATSAGTSLGPIVAVTDLGQQSVPPQMLRSDMIGAAASVPIEAGEATIDTRVTTVWELGPAESATPQ